MLIVQCTNCGQKYSIPMNVMKFTCRKCGFQNILSPTEVQRITEIPRLPPLPSPPVTRPNQIQPPPPPRMVSSVTSASGGKIVISVDDVQEGMTAAPHTSMPRPLMPPIPPMPQSRPLSPRERRLISDEKETYDYFSNFPLIKIVSSSGNPANHYVIEYNIRGIERIESDSPIYRDIHQVEIQLGGTYPRQQPICKMLTPIFHPNIEPAVICIGDHWTAQERLSQLIVRIGEIIAYQSYNIRSPLDGEAAMWADLHGDLLPTDTRFLMPE